MTITVSVAMMAHPKRARQVDEILSELDRKDVEVVWDKCESRWDTGKRSMLAYDPGCTHHAVIQDDVMVCRDLFAGIVKALEFVPSDVAVCGYVGRVRPYAPLVDIASRNARASGATWLTMHTLNWGPLIVVPTRHIPDMVAYCDKLRDIPNYDRRLSRYWELCVKAKTYYTWPSLVDHRDGPSLVEGRMGTDRKHAHPGRVAHMFLGTAKSALDVKWSARAIDADSPGFYNRGPEVVYRNKHTGQELHLGVTSPRVRRLQGLPSWELVDQGGQI